MLNKEGMSLIIVLLKRSRLSTQSTLIVGWTAGMVGWDF